MRNKTGKPYAFAELGAGGYWEIYFDPSPKLDGYFYYECLQGPIDGGNADKIVDLLNDEAESQSLKEELTLTRDALRKILKMRYSSGRGPESFDRVKDAVKRALNIVVL